MRPSLYSLIAASIGLGLYLSSLVLAHRSHFTTVYVFVVVAGGFILGFSALATCMALFAEKTWLGIAFSVVIASCSVLVARLLSRYKQRDTGWWPTRGSL
ncbi:MAG TPA: hypothetical protein VLE48_06240 [Terriglobales bacterium]|nr:hypothetical protein [Terriglobales bacterium]